MSMPWKFMPDGISKRVFMYLLQRYLGQFFEEKLTIDQLQLHVDRHNGTGTVENVSLDVQALNELGEQQNWPMEFVDGYIEKLTVTVPWSAILKDSSFVVVRGLKLTLQPKRRCESAASMFESMWSSMTNSMQLAQECMKQESPSSSDNSQTLEGIESFAETIDSILSRVKVKFIDTIIQVEHVPKDSSSGVGIQIKIDLMQYLDEAGEDPPTGEKSEDSEQKKAYVASLFSSKNIFLDGVSLYTVEFPSSSRTFSRCVLEQTQPNNLPEMAHFLRRTDDTGSLDNHNYRKTFEVGRHVILFAKLSGRQEIIIRMKQSETISGPKVSIEMQFGAFAAFMSPRQVYVLVELANGLASPDIEDNSNVMPKDKSKEKPMTQFDYNRIEQELLLHMHPLHNQSQGLAGHGWSIALDENDDERFLPMGHKTTGSIFDSTISNVSSSMDSSIASSMASSATASSARAQKRANNMESDPTAEISHFQIGISSVVMFLLHEDVLSISPTDLKTIMPASVLQMQNMSKQFFDDNLFLSGYGAKDIDKVGCLYNKRSERDFPNHLRLMAAPIQIEAKETTTQSAFSVSGKLDISRLELIENVTDSQEKLNIVKLLEFSSNGSINDEEISKPNVVFNFKHIEKTVRSGASPRLVPASKTDVDIVLDECIIEVDITIVDRLKCLLDPIPICVLRKHHQNNWSLPSTATIMSSPIDSKCNIKVTSPSICVKLRFPIPDLRPHSDSNRIPWYRRSIRNDYLLLQFSHATIDTTMQTSESSQKYTLDCRSLDVFYYDNENVPPLPIAKSCVDDKYLSSMQDGFNWPRITLQVLPVIRADIEMHHIPDPEADLMSQSIYGHLINQNPKEPGPFCAKWMLHESDTPHSKAPQDDSEEVVIPGDKEEMDNFIEMTTQNSRIQLELMLPIVSVQLLNKHIYEVLYNRINSDLLLWEPSAPQLLFPTTIDNQKIITGFPDKFLLCKSGINYDSDSEDATQSNIFYSAYEPRTRHVAKDSYLQLSTENSCSQSQFALNVHIAMGIVNMNAPVRDAQSNVIPNQQGEFVLNIEDAAIFSVSGYKGDPDVGFVCVQVGDAQLYHCDMRSTPRHNPPLYDVGAVLGKHLSPTIAKSDPGALQETTNRGGGRDFLSLTLKLHSNHETHQAKIIKLAMGLNKATLKHRKCAEPNSWISQLIDFFNVVDYTIPGYSPKEVLTEMHLHLWDCAIDYRPKYLPLRSVLTLGNFTMSSHITAQSYTSTLRFIAEECCLFLSEKAPPKDGKPSLVQIDLKKDYVNVVELGLFELSLKINEKRSGIYPLIDLRASNNILHIRTCADSGSALMQLITYFAGDGDYMQSSQRSTSSSHSSPRHQCEQDLVSVDSQNISKLTESQQEQVNELLHQAMEEEVSLEKLINTHPFTGEKIFFFPDEKIQRLEGTNPLHYVTHELGDVPFRSYMSSDYDTDDEFCFIDDVGCGGKPMTESAAQFGWDNKMLGFDEDYFITECKQDMMKSPEEYPYPMAKYMLREMTIYWHMYGGNDFKTSDKQQPKKTVNFSDNLSPSVGFTNTQTGEVTFKQHENISQKPKINWLIKGGLNRNQDVRMQVCLKKVRISHEVYPEFTHEASRQVMIISEFEIKDKLQCSNINKFLHYYTDYKAPRQSNSHMLSVKSLFVRPDTKLKAQECCLRVTMLPLRLNIDQDAVEFLMEFFRELTAEPKHDETPLPSAHQTPTHQAPVMSVSDSNEELSTAIEKSERDLLILNNQGSRKDTAGVKTLTDDDSTMDLSPIFFRTIVFSNDTTIRIDYQSKHVDMTHGAVQGIVMGYIMLNDLKIRLRKLQYRHGILGIDKLAQYFIQEWHDDFIANQKTSLLAGLGPSQSFRKLFAGIIDFFWLPIAQYRKDGRIVRGLQRGARSLTTSSFVALLELTSRVINVILMVAEVAFNMLSSGKSTKRIRHNPPQDLREGMANAYTVVRAGLGETADNLIRVASHEREQKGYSGAVGGILRQIPPTIIQPIIIASEATNNLLDGMRSQLAPDVKQEATEKWKKSDRNV